MAPRTMRRLIEAGEIPVVTVRRTVRIRAADLRTYVDAHVHKKHNSRCAGPDVRKGGSTCHTDAKTVPFGGRRTSTQADKELDDLLEQRNERKRKP